MIKVKATIENVKTKRSWEEEFEVSSMEKAEEGVQLVIDRFNDTCEPGENHRALVKIVGDTGGRTHDWDKQSLMFQEDRGGCYNDWKCTKCGLMKRVYGIRHPSERMHGNDCYPERTCNVCNTVFASEKNCIRHKKRHEEVEE